MIDSSSQDDRTSSWKASPFSADAESKMLASAFASVSISGNRPPALSVSSISSIGEDLNHKGIDVTSYYSNSGTPSSPLSNASLKSHFYNTSSAKSSPAATVIRHEGCITPTHQSETSKGFCAHNLKYSSFDSGVYAMGNHKSLPTFKEHIGNADEYFSSNEIGYDLRFEDRSHSFQESSFSKPRRSNSDSSETGNVPVLGNWPPSNARSTHSLNNMGSLDENEQYLGNRARSASATATLGHNRTLGSSTSFSHQADNSYPHFPSRNRESDFSYPRQRVLSADAVQHKASRNHPYLESSQSMTSHTLPHSHTSNPFADEHNRPRSFSSGSATYPTSPSYHNSSHTHNYFVDCSATSSKQPPSMQGHVADGNQISHSVQLNDLQYSNHHLGQASARPHNMYEQQYYPPDGGYSNQERFIRLRQAQEFPEKSQPYYQNFDTHRVAPRTVYTVKFKRSQKNFFLSNNIRGNMKIGSYVKVEADRGEDLGIILSRIPIEKFNPGARLNTPSMEIPDLQLKRITSLASESDIALLGLKEEEEAELLKICRHKTLQRGLPMNVVDAEYQFDRHKLTFFFEASCRVDFRELVRDLFSIYKTRIWMQQIDKVPGSPLPIHVSVENMQSYRISSERLGLNNHCPHGSGRNSSLMKS